jgi:hypothetical protein
MGIEEDIIQILKEDDTRSLARTLIERRRLITPPSGEDEECLTRILDDVSRELPQHRAMWVAFWLGCAWQKGNS